ncbi:hypothetical protein PF005_g20474, partial [Phytophthora fragariae]
RQYTGPSHRAQVAVCYGARAGYHIHSLGAMSCCVDDNADTIEIPTNGQRLDHDRQPTPASSNIRIELCYESITTRHQ